MPTIDVVVNSKVEKAVALESNSKIDPSLVSTGTSNGVAPLDVNSKVPLVNLPSFMPQSKRIWRDVKSLRTTGTWYNNSSPNEREVYVRASLAGAPANRFVSLRIRENTGGTIFIFNSTVLLNVGASLTYADSNTITVPAGWQYQLSTTGGSTDALTELWYELY